MKITNAYFLKELVQAAHYFTFDRTVKAVKILCHYDSLYKSSERGSATDGGLLTEMICRMMA